MKVDSVKFGTLSIAFAKIYFLIAGYALYISLSRILTVEQFGLYGVIFSVVSLINMVLINGTLQAVSRFVAHAPEENALAIRRFCFIHQLLFAFFFLSIYFLLTPWIADFLKDPSLLFYLRLGTLITFFYSFYAVNVGYLNGRHLFFKQAALDVGFATLKVAAMVFLVYIATPRHRLAYAIYGFIVAAAIIFVVSFFVTGFKFERKELSITTKEYIHFAFAVLGIFFILNFFLSIDLILLKRLLPNFTANRQTGYYTAAQSIARIPFYLMNTAVLVIFPMVAKIGDIRENQEEASRITSSAISLVFIFLLGIVAVITPIGPEVVRVLYPSKLLIAGKLLPTLVLAMSLLSIMHLGLSMISSSGKANVAMFSFAGFFVLQVLLLFFLIPRYGMLGAAVSTALAAGIGMLVVLFLLHRYFKTRYSLDTILKTFLMATFAFFTVRASQSFLATHSKIFTVLVIGFIYILYLASLYYAKILVIPKKRNNI